MQERNIKNGQKSLAKNASFNALYRVANMVFPLIIAIYVSHILLASGVGIVSKAQNIVQYFVLIAPLGIANYGTREIARIRDSKEKTDQLFTNLFVINLTSTLFCVAAYYTLIALCPYFAEERLLYYVAGLPIVFNVINVEWFYQGHEDYVYISIRSIIVKFLSLIAIIIFVNDANDYIVYALIYTFGIAGNYFFNIVNLIIRGTRFDFTNITYIKHLKPMLILLCSNVAIELYTLLDTTMLGFYCEDSIVGYYSNSLKLVRTIVMLIAAIGTVLLPRLSYYKEHNQLQECNSVVNDAIKVMFFFAIPFIFAVIILARQLVLVMYGASFVDAVLTVKIGALLILAVSFSNLFGIQILLTFDQEKQLLLCTCVGAVSNILMNMVLIPLYQHNGAIVASVISECLVTALTLLFAKRYIVIDFDIKFILQVFISSLMMGACLGCIVSVVGNNILCLLISMFIGSILYFILNYAFGNYVMLLGVKILKKRLTR